MHRLALGLFTAIAFSACSVLGLGEPFIRPQVHLANLVFEDATFFETSMRFTVRIDNENSYPLRVSGGTHRFYLNDTYVGKGFSREGFEVPALSSVTEEVPVTLSNLSLLNKITSLVEEQRLAYKIDSNLKIGKGFSSRTVSFENEGVFEFPVAAGVPRSPSSRHY